MEQTRMRPTHANVTPSAPPSSRSSEAETPNSFPAHQRRCQPGFFSALVLGSVDLVVELGKG
eukprot:235006-Hanusia_phi.AAC.2